MMARSTRITTCRPDQVIANVQAALQQQGYYQGEVDGLLGPLTRAAIADYQRANGLAETAAIDQPTLQLLGIGATRIWIAQEAAAG